MTERVKQRLEYFRSREYRSLRNTDAATDMGAKNEGLSLMACRRNLFAQRVKEESPVFYGDDIIGFNQSRVRLAFDSIHLLQGAFGNICIDYESVLKGGLNGLREEIVARYEQADKIAKEFYDEALLCLDIARDAVKKYRDGAKRQGNEKLYQALCTVPENGTKDYYQAIVTVRFMQYILRLNGTTHVTLGRFDQYAKPYFDASKAAGATDEELLELTELFFLSLNMDSDIYVGVQMGDNGQSMMLGGCDEKGRAAFNELSEICLTASEELKVIDPKINIRVNKDTPLSLYERGTRLTKQGLGFPQYSNDDVVIPGLIALGYDEKDARNYTVAACWEFIIPAYGADIPNIGTMNFPLSVELATKKYLLYSPDYPTFEKYVERQIREDCADKIESLNRCIEPPDAFLSIFIRPCIEKGRDISCYGGKYNNYGIHGAGIANAADALEAIERAVFIEKSVGKTTLLRATCKDFVGYEDVQKRLLACPKMGNNEDSVDAKAAKLMGWFADSVNLKPNNRGGVYRAGTGSAHEYHYSASYVGATADGRNAAAPFGSSFSPAITTHVNGPLSAIASFTKFDLSKIINGGPFTIEIHDTVFRNDEGEKKTAMLVKAFIDRGGHQIQINAVNREILLQAQAHPERYPNLIVRVWGWSGYFNELDPVFQNHIIRRMEYTF
ncbi:MAG: pyruvate formate-lyase [Clostridia bacterium]|nr:pyruvate formate-lyase [Clostridia bacterium]